ncbi:MAG: hypothetical protein AAF152_15280, partial [Cyanobacteria bacterium P01_A01_bin.114]
MFGAKIFTTLGQKPLDRLGDLNPQLLREMRGRLKRFPVLVAVGLSLLCQIAMMIGFSLALPGSVQLEDLNLSTYPSMTWHGASNLDPQPLQDFLPLETPNRDKLLTAGLVIDSVNPREPLRGDKTNGLDALNKIQVGDRLVAVNGQPITLNKWPAQAYDVDYNLSELSTDINEKVVGAPGTNLTPERLKLIGTDVELDLYRAGQGRFKVTVPRIATANKHSRYCFELADTYTCDVTPDKQAYLVNWSKWYGDVFVGLTALIVFPLMGGGMFLLASNLAEEKRRGTLNFLQLSPRSSLSILGGKLLGVPICLYLALGLVLPLQWFIGLRAGHNIVHMVGFDIALVSQTLIFYSLTLLFSLSISHAMLLGLLPWLLAASVTTFQWILFLYTSYGEVFRNADSNALLWSLFFSPFTSLAYFAFEQPVSKAGANMALGIFRLNFTEYTILTLVHGLGWCALLGHGIQRRFSNAHTTLLKRRYSYGLTLIFSAIVVGLTEVSVKNYDHGLHVTLYTLFGFVYCIALTAALAPARQTIKDWARFRHAEVAQRLPLWKDLLIGEASSPVVAISLNLMLVTGLLTGGLLWLCKDLIQTRTEALIATGSVLLFVGSILFMVLVSQTLTLLPRKKNWIWFGIMSSISCFIFPAMTLALSVV